jgi:L-ascorbate metabolism protein UlaG (beta-lactamase superfamily)
MNIKWLGQATFVIESQTTLVTDPFNPMLGKLPKDLTAAVVTVSHAHADHNYTKGVGGQPQVIELTGDFSAGGFAIQGIATFHDDELGKKRGSNVLYVIRAENMTLCHLGDLGHLLSEQQIAEIGAVDVLMIPVGGFVTIGPEEAVKVIAQLKPKLVLPMHYKAKKSLIPLPIAGVDKFTAALGWEVETVDELSIERSTLDSAQQHVVVFRR